MLNPKLSRWQRLMLRIFKKAYLGHHTKSGWTGTLPFYAFRCPTHGVVVDYPHGYNNRLDCPLCQTMKKDIETLRQARESLQ
jgi:hypothetical protein